MKRILSIVLACALIVGIMPMSFAAGDSDYNEYIFTAASHGVEVTDEKPFVDMATGICGLDATVVGDKWAYVNDLSANKRDVGYENIRLRHLISQSDANARPGELDATNNGSLYSGLILELLVDVEGDVVPSIAYKTSTSGTKNDIYLIEKSSIASIANWASTTSRVRRQAVFNHVVAHPEQRLGMIDAYGDKVETKTESFRKYNVKPGNYYLVILPNGANDNWKTERLDARYVGSFDIKSFMLSENPSAKADFFYYDTTLNALTSDALTKCDTSGDGILGAKELHNVTVANGVIDATKSDEFSLMGRVGHDAGQLFEANGFWQEVTVQTNTVNYFEADSFLHRPFYAITINVPYSGKYKVSVINKRTQAHMKEKHSAFVGKGAVTIVHFGKKTTAIQHNASTGRISNPTMLDDLIKDTKTTTFGNYYNPNTLATSDTAPAVTELGEVSVEAGEYYVIFDVNAETFAENSAYYNRYTSGDNANNDRRQYFAVSGIQLTLVEDTEQAKVQQEYDSIINVNPGNATEKAPASTTSNVKILCGADNSVLDTDDVAAGSDITYTAPEKEGYTFLYWAQGMGEFKKIASYDEKLSVKAEKGPMWLTAVYADNNSTKTDVIFYNANGDEISRSQYNENDAIMLPALPSLAGFDAATGWTLDADGETYTADDEVRASGKLMRFVAEYSDEPSESFEITVIGGTADNATPAYGETVTVTAPARKNNTGMQLFNYWERDGEVVSFDRSYSFKAWKDTTVTAVYNDYTPVAKTVRKIILGTRLVGGETAAVAEFIGLSDVVEKGILFGTDIDNATHKVSMKTEGDTFSVIDDVSGEAIGYAILSNGKVIYSK